ncbi:MAG: RlmE family RNA methyltransferase [Thermoplasmatales archaeon]|nr:RlmE family RNA methyltransferase [Thermoplasmatales archaeon]
MNWVLERKRDHYYKEAKKHGYRARSAFKLIQINNRYHILRKGSIIVDLGASPGGWSQVASKYGKVIAVDIKRMAPIEGVEFIEGDITDEKTVERIKEIVSEVDAVISDASPSLSGKYEMDQAKSVWLCESAFKIAKELLKENGNFVCKIFEGSDFREFLAEVKKCFNVVKLHRPQATRKASSEIYIVAKGYKKYEGN